VTIDIIYADILLGRRDIEAGEFGEGEYRLSFVLPEDCWKLLREPRIEFRVWSDGGADIVIHGLSLKSEIDDGMGTAAPAVSNWQALLLVGSAADTDAAGRIAAKARSGRVFYGPYYFLLPGAYVFQVELDVSQLGGARETFVLETIGPQDHVLARQRFKVHAGMNRLEIGFEIPPADSLKDLVGPLEFRLDKTGSSEFRCVKAELAMG
jgi:hypothetical protein